jgi:metal-responsive CopG/Arc/MetJ family transcriptional regulator
MSSNLEFELKVRITPEMSKEIDAVVATRPAGVNRSHIVREALTSYLGDQLHQIGKAHLGEAKSDFAKAAKAIKGSIRKR